MSERSDHSDGSHGEGAGPERACSLSCAGFGALLTELERANGDPSPDAALVRLGSHVTVCFACRTRYRERLEKCGLKFAGLSPDGLLPETVEYPDHPWFIGVQYHPELKSRPFEPHPLFASFIAAAIEQSRLV